MSSLPSAITATFARAGAGTYGGSKGGMELAKTEPRTLQAKCLPILLYYGRTYCSVSNTKGSRCHGF